MTTAREKAIRAHIRNFLYPMTETEMMIVLDEAIYSRDSVRIKYVGEYIDECRANGNDFAG